jgi:hypothetical protein
LPLARSIRYQAALRRNSAGTEWVERILEGASSGCSTGFASGEGS